MKPLESILNLRDDRNSSSKLKISRFSCDDNYKNTCRIKREIRETIKKEKRTKNQAEYAKKLQGSKWMYNRDAGQLYKKQVRKTEQQKYLSSNWYFGRPKI
jgi:hypothetical protein